MTLAFLLRDRPVMGSARPLRTVASSSRRQSGQLRGDGMGGCEGHIRKGIEEGRRRRRRQRSRRPRRRCAP